MSGADGKPAYQAVENALMEWFHGSEKHPYTASGHAENALDCWHCEEATNVAVQALLDRGVLAAKPDPPVSP